MAGRDQRRRPAKPEVVEEAVRALARGRSLTLRLAPGGGYAVVFSRAP